VQSHIDRLCEANIEALARMAGCMAACCRKELTYQEVVSRIAAIRRATDKRKLMIKLLKRRLKQLSRP
jgi:hypothetical protein